MITAAVAIITAAEVVDGCKNGEEDPLVGVSVLYTMLEFVNNGCFLFALLVSKY